MTAQEVWKKFCGKQPVIDIGCGWHEVFDFEYVKFDKASMICGAKTCVNHFGDFHDMSDFADGMFAFVNATEAIEHAEFPNIALSEWLRILQVGGVIHLSWPGTEVWDREKLVELREAVDKNDMARFLSLGGNVNWISIDKDSKNMLDVHYHKITLDLVKKLLGDRIEVLAEGPCSLIARKVY